MNESTRAADQLHRAFFGQAWHGPALKDALAGVTAQAAADRPIASGHSIFELVRHLHAWILEADQTVRGKEYESMKGDRDWPPVTDTSDSAWQHVLGQLEEAQNSLEEAVHSLPPEKLGNGAESLYYLIHGIAEHAAYHAGQIALLKKISTGSKCVDR